MLRVQTLAENGLLRRSCNSEWVYLLNDTVKPSPVRNLILSDKREYSKEGLNMSIEWKPNEDDMTCDYKVMSWNTQKSMSIEDKDYYMEFNADLHDLNYNTTYDVFVYGIIAGQDSGYDTYSNATALQIKTPSCLDVWNNSLSICIPPAPTSMNVTFLDIAPHTYEMNVSWTPGAVAPEEYIIYLSQSEPQGNRSEYRRVNGATTSVLFKDVKPETIYLVCIIAASTAGNSSLLHEYRKFRAPPHKKWEYSETIVVSIVSLCVVGVLMMVGCSVCYRLVKKRREKIRRCQYFEGLEKEVPKDSKECENSTYFDDEWEIPEDRLLVGEIIGGGAFGVVHQGLLHGQSHIDPFLKVAIKMLKADTPHEDVRQFQQEINMMKSVGKHPHIVSIIGCCTASKDAKLVVEYCPLGDLHNYLRQNGLKLAQIANQTEEIPEEGVKYAELISTYSSDAEHENQLVSNVAINQMYFNNSAKKEPDQEGLQPADLISFARQIAMGMEYLSSNRIIHRDLAARNVLVCTKKMVKISDFGLSRDIYEQNVYQKKESSKLPIKWMAIESLMYQLYTTQSDVWSFGVLLWEIVTLGAMPYPSTPGSRIFQLLKTGYRMECPPNCSEELYEIMLSCWREKPKERPTFVAVHNKLDKLLENSSAQKYLNLNTIDLFSTEISSSTEDSLSHSEKCNTEHCRPLPAPESAVCTELSSQRSELPP